jgi:hypothetical protein
MRAVTNDLLYAVPIGIVLLALFAAMLATWDIGRRIGIRERERSDEDARTHVSGLLGALLGLLALLLGFTFSMAAQRFETNREMVAHEANAIATAYRRADMAAEPERLALKNLIRRYVDARVHLYEAKIDLVKRNAITAESRRLQDEMWQQAMVTAARAPTSTTALLVEGVNQLIDEQELRLQAVRNHVPPTILWLLMLMSAIATGLMGFVSGFGNRRHRAPTIVVIGLIALVIVVIVDLDRPTRGFIRGGQDALLDLQRAVRAEITAVR